MVNLIVNLVSLSVLAVVAWRFRAVVKSDALALKHFILAPWNARKVRALLAYSLLGAWLFGFVWVACVSVMVHLNQH